MNTAINTAVVENKEYGFSKEHPSLTEKRKEAIKYLGTKYCLHPNSTFVGSFIKR